MNIAADPSQAQPANWGVTVGTAVALQWAVVLLLAGLAWIWSGARGAESLLAGGAAVALPNALLALWLTLRRRQAGTLGVPAMLAGEFLKLGGTIALMVLAVKGLRPDVSWLAVVIGVIAALKAHWLALWFTRQY